MMQTLRLVYILQLLAVAFSIITGDPGSYHRYCKESGETRLFEDEGQLWKTSSYQVETFFLGYKFSSDEVTGVVTKHLPSNDEPRARPEWFLCHVREKSVRPAIRSRRALFTAAVYTLMAGLVVWIVLEMLSDREYWGYSAMDNKHSAMALASFVIAALWLVCLPEPEVTECVERSVDLFFKPGAGEVWARVVYDVSSSGWAFWNRYSADTVSAEVPYSSAIRGVFYCYIGPAGVEEVANPFEPSMASVYRAMFVTQVCFLAMFYRLKQDTPTAKSTSGLAGEKEKQEEQSSSGKAISPPPTTMEISRHIAEDPGHIPVSSSPPPLIEESFENENV